LQTHDHYFVQIGPVCQSLGSVLLQNLLKKWLFWTFY